MLVKRHGQDAPIHAAMRADAMLDKGDLDGLQVLTAVQEAVCCSNNGGLGAPANRAGVGCTGGL